MRRFIFIFIACYSGTSDAFTTQQNAIGLRSLISNNQDSHDVTGSNYATCTCPSRRSIVTGPVVASLLTLIANDKAQAADGSLNVLVGQLKESSKMMDVIPDLIKAEKWDAVRAILIKPPLSDLWSSGGTKQLLKQYADAIGNELPDGDEIAALELREDAISHLRYLDMAVYNNVFNPISTEGQSGATKELIRSYYEDPINEWKASKAALDGLIGLSTP